MNITGKVHSIETCGTVDGPGIRFVIFMQGCPLRCQYCHNPDTWNTEGGTEYTTDKMVAEIIKYESYMKFSKGGVTATGGEPLLQVDFLIELFKKLKARGIHTALDTSGFIFNSRVKEILEYTDLVLLDVKHIDPNQYQKITGVKIDSTLQFLDYLGEIKKPAWIRYVLVPGLSDQDESIEALSKHLGQYDNIEKIELLPFHKMGEYKWEELGIDYPLKDTPEPDKATVVQAMALLKKHNMNVTTN